MPLFYQHTINEHTRLAVWKIGEEESFFSAVVNVQRNISHPHKRLQHLAGRYLLPFLFPDFPSWLIQIADTRKPFLAEQSYQFSISHADNYAAAIVSSNCNVSVDVEPASQKIAAIRHKFLSEHDAEVLFTGTEADQDRIPRLTIAWSAKEAVYKWWGKGEVDFKKDIIFDSMIENDRGGHLTCIFNKAEPVWLVVHYKLFDILVLAWIAEP